MTWNFRLCVPAPGDLSLPSPFLIQDTGLMQRSLCVLLVGISVLVSSASTAKACFPFALLDPFVWLGCPAAQNYYGMNCCAGYGYGYAGYGCQPYMGHHFGAYAPSYTPGYAPMQTDCNCVAVQQPAFTPVQVPVTSYRPVTQYVPQITYQTRYQPTYAAQQFAPQISQSFSGHPLTNTPQIGQSYSPYSPTYVPSHSVPANRAPFTGIASPVPGGDITGDHEYPSSSGLMPVAPAPYVNSLRVQPASYRVAPQPARSYSGVVR